MVVDATTLYQTSMSFITECNNATTMQMPPWLEDLSDDWPSETSSLISCTSRRPSKYQPSAERTGKSGSLKPKKRRSSRTALGDRKGNAIFFNQGHSHQSTERVSDKGSWDVGLPSLQSTINGGTVQQKTPLASPTKATQMMYIPEWKKRLVHGEMAYGEQKDLFSPIGLENIFQQGNRANEQINRPRLKEYKSPTNQKSSVKKEKICCGNENGHISTRRRSRCTDRQRRLSQSSEFSDRPSGVDTQNYDQVTDHVNNDKEFVTDRRFISGQTELNEEFSPVFISKQSTVSGKVNYAADGSYQNNMEKKLLSTTDSQNTSLRSRKEKPGCDRSQVSMLSGDLSMGTPDIAELGDFVTCKRGGYSAENSFRNRPLSPSPTRQSRAHIFSTHKSRHLGTASTENRDVPALPRNSESHRSTPSPQRKYLVQPSNSPLKLFGDHDTFTNHQLLRRMGQLQNSDELTLSNNQSEQVISAGITLSPANKRKKSLTKLTASEPSVGSNHTELHMKLTNVPNAQTSIHEREAVCLISTPTEMDKKSQSSTKSDRSPSSSIFSSDSVLPTNCTAFPALKPSANCNIFNPTETLRRSTHTHATDILNTDSSHLDLQKILEPSAYADGKRPQSSPTKSPTPKRRRTLIQLETLNQIDKELEIQENKETDHCPQNNEKGENPFGDLLDNANLDVLPKRRSSQPLHPVSDQWRKQGRTTGELLYQGHVSELEPISEYGEFQTTSQKLFTWNSQSVAIDNRQAYPNTQADTRKHSLTTQDYIDEAMKIMSWIRNNRPKSGLASLEEAEGEQLDESMGSEASLTLSRPPSREGRTTKWRDPNSHELHSRVNNHLQKYRENENDDIVLSSLEGLRISDTLEEVEAPQSSSDTIRITHSNSFVDAGEKEGTVQAPNAPSNLETRYSDTSDKFSSGRTNITEGSRRSENVTTFAPDAVAHLIPKEIAGMTFDKEKGMWVRIPSSLKRKDVENKDLSTTESDDDPFQKIPDLVVDEEEYRNGATSGQLHYTAELGEMLQKNVQLNSENASESENNATTIFPLTKVEKYIDVDHEFSINEGRTGSQKRAPNGRKSIAVSFPTQLLAHVPLQQDRRKSWQHLEASAKEEYYRPVLSSSKDSQKRQSLKSHNGTRSAKPTNISTQKQSTISKCVEQHERGKEILLQTADRTKRNSEVAIAVTSPSCQNEAAVTAAGSPGTVADVTFYLSELSEFSVNQIDEREVNPYTDNKEVVFYQKVPVQPFEVSTGALVRVLQDAKPEELYWEDIRHLVMDNKNLNTLYNLDYFCSQLQALNVAQNNLRQLNGAPPSIRQLDVSSNQLSSLTTWAHLANLQYLDVSGNNIDNLAGFGELIHLRELRADNNQLTSVDGISTLDALITLSLTSNQFTELDFTSSNFKRLTELNVSNNSIETIHGLQYLQALEKIDLDENKIRIFPKDHTAVPLCSRLVSLKLRRNGLEEIEIGNSFPNLKELYIDNNNVSWIKGAEEGKHLEILSARYQRVLGKPGYTGPTPYDIAFLAHHDVRKLFLSCNSISRLQISTCYMCLEHFELASSGLYSLPVNFGALAPNLRTANLNCNSLKDITPLLGLKKLKSLTIAGNRLVRLRKSIAVLQTLPDLERLDLRDNPFTVGFYEPLIQNKLLRREDIGLLEHNLDPYEIAAANTEADVRYRRNLDEATQLRRRVYEMLIATHCPKLQSLDGLPFSKENVKTKDTSWARLIDLGVIRPSKAGVNSR